jgi:hypothetical protein
VRLLDVFHERSASALVGWANETGTRAGGPGSRPRRWTRIAVCLGLRAALPRAVRVLDAFHVVRLGFTAVDEVGRRIQQELTGHRGRRDDPLYGIRRQLRRGHEHHSERSRARLLARLDADDTADEQLPRTWVATQELRLIFSCPDRARAEQALYRWLAYCADAMRLASQSGKRAIATNPSPPRHAQRLSATFLIGQGPSGRSAMALPMVDVETLCPYSSSKASRCSSRVRSSLASRCSVAATL